MLAKQESQNKLKPNAKKKVAEDKSPAPFGNGMTTRFDQIRKEVEAYAASDTSSIRTSSSLQGGPADAELRSQLETEGSEELTAEE